MLFQLLITILVGFLVWFYIRWTRVRQFWAQRNVPFDPPNLIFGSIMLMLSKNPLEWFREVYEKDRSPYRGAWLFWRPTLIVNSQEIIRRVLVKDADLFRNRFAAAGKSDPIGHLNLFLVNDPIWSSVRRRLTPIFTSAKLKKVRELGSSKTKELIQRFYNEIEKGNVIDLKSIYSDFTTDIIGSAAFGVASEATLTGDGAMRKLTKEFTQFDILRGLSMLSIFFYPALADFLGCAILRKSTVDFFRKIFRSAVIQRGGYENHSGEVKDLLDALVKMKIDAAKDNEDMSEDLLVAQAAIFLQAGFDTSSLNLTFATYELAYNSDVQEKLYQELLEAKQNFGELTVEVLTDLKYLDCVIKETLRKYPAISFLDRVSSTDYKIDEKLTIPAGTPVYVNIIGLHFDPQYFPEPEKFNPDRFLNDEIKPFTFLPFGDGPRNCIGKRFAYQNIRFALSSVILAFELRPLPKFPQPSQIKFEKNFVGISNGELLSVEFVPRSSK